MYLTFLADCVTYQRRNLRNLRITDWLLKLSKEEREETLEGGDYPSVMAQTEMIRLVRVVETSHTDTVNSEIFARIFISTKSFKIYATLKLGDFGMIHLQFS